jgi:hypothetical protein
MLWRNSTPILRSSRVSSLGQDISPKRTEYDHDPIERLPPCRRLDWSEVSEMSSLESRAAALVNPASGIANDYLNHFNEILLLIENLPALLPEMVDELLAWRPISYRQYFTDSPLPGSAETLKIYDSLDEDFRVDFENMVVMLDKIILESIEVIKSARRPDGTLEPDEVSDTCEKLSARLRKVLDRTADLVNHGYAPPFERAQDMANRILNSSPRNMLAEIEGE